MNTYCTHTHAREHILRHIRTRAYEYIFMEINLYDCKCEYLRAFCLYAYERIQLHIHNREAFSNTSY